MEEQRAKTRPAVELGGSPGNDLFEDLGAFPTGGGMATVIHGAYRYPLPVAEMTIAQVRRRFTDLLDIHPEATPVVDGSPVDDETVIAVGQTLMFLRRSGEKGLVRSSA